MPLDVQRTMFAARQSELARRQAQEGQRQALDRSSVAATQSELNKVLKEQRDFYAKEFERLSKMAAVKGQQDMTLGIESTIPDERYREYYQLGRQGTQVADIEGQRAAEAARQKAIFDTMLKVQEAEQTGVTGKNVAQGQKFGAEARGRAAENLVFPQKFAAEQAERYFRAGQSPYGDERYAQLLGLRPQGMSINIGGDPVKQVEQLDKLIRTENAILSEIQPKLIGIDRTIIEELAKTNPAQAAELRKLIAQRDQALLNKGNYEQMMRSVLPGLIPGIDMSLSSVDVEDPSSNTIMGEQSEERNALRQGLDAAKQRARQKKANGR